MKFSKMFFKTYRSARQVARGEHQGPTPPQPSHPHNTTNMGAMEEAIAALESLSEGEDFTY
jgi:hypothetical protein